jgi:hypothetical protein
VQLCAAASAQQANLSARRPALTARPPRCNLCALPAVKRIWPRAYSGHTFVSSPRGRRRPWLSDKSRANCDCCHLTTCAGVIHCTSGNMARSRHPNKEIEAAVQHAEDKGWRVTSSKGHAWGKMCCPFNDPECRCGLHCITSIWSTPRNPEYHARDLRRKVDKCTGKPKVDDAKIESEAE